MSRKSWDLAISFEHEISMLGRKIVMLCGFCDSSSGFRHLCAKRREKFVPSVSNSQNAREEENHNGGDASLQSLTGPIH
jgi:hypothetical protein